MLSSVMSYPRILAIVPCAIYSRISLLIHSKGNSLHLLTPSSQSIPLPYPLSNHKSILQVHDFLFCGKVHLCILFNYEINPEVQRENN